MKLKAVVHRTIFYLPALFLTFGALSVSGAGYIKFDGIDGEAQDRDHAGWSNFSLLEFGAERTGDSSVGGGGGGKVSFKPVTCIKELDKATPLLFQACATGEPIPSVEIALERSSNADGGKVEYLLITLTNVLISSVTVEGSAAGDEVPTEEVSLNFEKIKVDYTPVRDNGSIGEVVSFSWNVALNTPD